MASKIAIMEDVKKPSSSSETKKQQKKKYKKNAWEQIDIESEKQKDPKYKTEMCAAFQENGFCPYGNRCRFAHGKSELFIKDVNHPNYKRKDCLSFHIHGFCTYGVRCHFKHAAEFHKISRSFFQLILMVYAYENLSVEEIRSYFFSDDEEKKEGRESFDFGFLEQSEKGNFESLLAEKKSEEALNPAPFTNRNRISSGSASESFHSPVKNKSYTSSRKSKISNTLEPVNASGEKISYTYNPKKSANKADFSGLKTKSNLLYKKRLSVFQSIGQLDKMRRKFAYNGFYGQNNYFGKVDGIDQTLSVNPFYNYNGISNANYFDNFNDTSVSTFNKIQKNFKELLISNKRSGKFFIPKEYRNNEFLIPFDVSNNNQKEKSDRTIPTNPCYYKDFKDQYQESFNSFTNNYKFSTPSDANLTPFNNFDNNGKSQLLNGFCGASSYLLEENNIDFPPLLYVNSIKNNNLFKNGFSKNLENFQHNFNCKYINNDNLSEIFPLNAREKTNKIKQSIVNSEKNHKNINILESNLITGMNNSSDNNKNNKSYIANFNKNQSYNYFRFNSYQKNLNYCKYDERSLVNINLDFSLCDSKTTCDNFDNFYNENISNIENLEYNCISPKASFDFNDDPTNIIKTLNFNADDKMRTEN